jgi:hypothetical protein
MDHVSSILGTVLKKRGITELAVSAQVIHDATAWMEQQFPLLHSSLHVSKLVSGTLFIEASHAVALQECRERIPDLLHCLHEYTEKKILLSVQVVRGK